VLRDFARQGHQLLVFTCHEHVWRMFQKLKIDARRIPNRFGETDEEDEPTPAALPAPEPEPEVVELPEEPEPIVEKIVEVEEVVEQAEQEVEQVEELSHEPIDTVVVASAPAVDDIEEPLPEESLADEPGEEVEYWWTNNSLGGAGSGEVEARWQPQPVSRSKRW
jgi:hypothetical protein